MTRFFNTIASPAGIGGLAAVAALSFLALAPVPNADQNDAALLRGRVEAVTSSCCGDVQIRLQNDACTYYINRGLEQGLDLDRIQNQLVGKQVEIHLIERSWSPLDPLDRMAPVSQVTTEGQVVYQATAH